jgi:heat shock protein HtpX
MKRIFLLLATNLAVMVMLSIVLSLLGVSGYIDRFGNLNFGALAIFCFVWGMGGAFISLAISRWVAKRSLGVQLVDGRTGREDLDWLHRTVERQAQMANLPMPEVGVYDSPEVNAFATGPSRSRSLVAVSTGLLRTMGRREIEGVLGHELSHIANGDMVTMTLLQGVMNAFVMFLARVIAFFVAQFIAGRSDGRRSDSGMATMVSFLVRIVLEIVFGIIGSMITAWFSRHREFRADAGGAQLAGRDSMVSALRRLQQTAELVDTQQAALATMKIAGAKGFMALLSTHPPLEQRIAALQNPPLQ